MTEAGEGADGGSFDASTWSKPESANLDEIETAVVRRLHPPLNLDKVGEPRNRLREARKRMADTSRAWQPGVGPGDGGGSGFAT